MAEERIAALEKQIASLTKEVQKGADIEGVRRIFNIYGYYFDKSLYGHVVGCFADHPDTRVYWCGGVWKGLEGVKRIYLKSYPDGLTDGHLGPCYGLLLDHMMMQDVITISEDGTRAKVFDCIDL
jgi:SnoaL-like domain